MLSREENELFTKVGPSTKMGEVLRRYWHPVGASQWVAAKPQRVKVLGEELLLYRGSSGPVLMQLRCAHRSLALDHGRVEGDCIRCPYHGWLYDQAGQCLDQPAEPEGSSFKEKVRLKAYKVQEAGGIVFGYLGPEPAPLLPLYDLLTVEDGVKSQFRFRPSTRIGSITSRTSSTPVTSPGCMAGRSPCAAARKSIISGSRNPTDSITCC